MLDPLISASLQVQIHVVAAVLSILIGPLALLRRSRDRVHKILGYGWVSAMSVTVASSFLIWDLRIFGPFSPIHILSVFTAVGLYQGVRYAVRRQARAHQRTMQQLYFWALGVAGTLSFMPGRIMNQLVFEGWQTAGFILVLSAAALTYFGARLLRVRQ